MADIVNDRVNTAQAELLKRAKKLESIVKQARGGRGGNRDGSTALSLISPTCFRTGNVRCGLRTVATNQK